MKLIWHIFKKDLCRLRWPLLLWTGLLLGQIAVGARLFSSGSLAPGWIQRESLFLWLTFLLEMAASYFLVAALVLEDALTDSRSFWVTRPISGIRLLSAKLLGIALVFFLWPVVVALPWWLFCGFGAKEAALAAVQTFGPQTAVVLLAMVLAAVTGRGDRFLLWTLVVLGVVPLLGVAFAGEVRYRGMPVELMATRYFMATGVAVLTASLVLWLQYRTRRTVRSIVALLTGAGLMFLVALFWPWSGNRFQAKNASPLPGTESIAVAFTQAKAISRNGRAWVSFEFTATGVPDNLVIFFGGVDAKFRWPDGMTVSGEGSLSPYGNYYNPRPLFNLPPARPDPATAKKRQELSGAMQRRIAELGLPHTPHTPLRPGEVQLHATVQIPIESMAKFAGELPACTAVLHLAVGRPVLLLELPLKEGASRSAHGVRIRVLKLELVGQPSRIMPDVKTSATVVYSHSTRMTNIAWYLVDRVHGTVAKSWLGHDEESPPAQLPPPLKFTREVFSFITPQVWRDHQWIEAPDWLKADMLAAVAFQPEGQFSRELKTNRLKIERLAE